MSALYPYYNLPCKSWKSNTQSIESHFKILDAKLVGGSTKSKTVTEFRWDEVYLKLVKSDIKNEKGENL